MSRRILIAMLIIAAIIFIISLFLWIVFPLIFPILADANLALTEGNDGMPSTSTFFWSKPPINAVMNFYFFNITNPDEVIYEGAKPSLQQLGPFAIRYSEQKTEYQFTADGSEVYYKNYKRYSFERELSCDYCHEDSPLTIPNAVAIGALNNMVDPKYQCDVTCRTLIDIGLLLLGENPFRTVKFMEVMFDGYNDPFLTFVHSDFYTLLCDLFNDGEPLVPFPIPDMELMAYFSGYNNSNDEDYIIKTGKANIEEMGAVVQWAGARGLPHNWWITPQARMINGSDSGNFNHPRLSKNDVLPFFLSLLCRSFYATYSGETTVSGIRSYTFETPYEVFDATLDENRGFRYENAERVNYFKEWDPCPNKTTFHNCSLLPFVDCSKRRNFCSECCDGNYVDGTYLLPPGMFPLKCYPGKTEILPFSLIFSAPHWVYSPPVVLNTVHGLSPSRQRHIPFVFAHEPISGMLTRAQVRLMASVPIFRNLETTIAKDVIDVLVPIFWIDADVKVRDTTLSTIRSTFVVLLRAILIAKIVTLAVSVFLACFATGCIIRQKLRRRQAAHHGNSKIVYGGIKNSSSY
uniref:CD36 family protein n=1 Tax=Parascaris univalens TaxID=6257 RepID=A0A915ABW6_PARUN